MRRPADGRATKRFSSRDPDSFRRALMPSVRPPPTEVNTTTGALRMSMRIFRQKGGILSGRRPPSWTHRVAGAMRATERGPAPPRPSECPSVQLVRDPELRHVVRPERPEDRTPGTLDRDPGAAQEEIGVDAGRHDRLEAEDAAAPGEEDGMRERVREGSVADEDRARQLRERIQVLVRDEALLVDEVLGLGADERPGQVAVPGGRDPEDGLEPAVEERDDRLGVRAG